MKSHHVCVVHPCARASVDHSPDSNAAIISSCSEQSFARTSRSRMILVFPLTPCDGVHIRDTVCAIDERKRLHLERRNAASVSWIRGLTQVSSDPRQEGLTVCHTITRPSAPALANRPRPPSEVACPPFAHDKEKHVRVCADVCSVSRNDESGIWPLFSSVCYLYPVPFYSRPCPDSDPTEITG
jgi:hypothetical protein